MTRQTIQALLALVLFAAAGAVLTAIFSPVAAAQAADDAPAAVDAAPRE
jgi:hypothetical protein